MQPSIVRDTRFAAARVFAAAMAGTPSTALPQATSAEASTPGAGGATEGVPRAAELQNVGSPPEGYDGPEPPRPPFRVTRPAVDPSLEQTLSELGDLTAVLSAAYARVATHPARSIAAATWVAEQDPLYAPHAALLAIEAGDLDTALYILALSRWGEPPLTAMQLNEGAAALRSDPRWPQVGAYLQALIEFWREQPPLPDTVVHPQSGEAMGILATMRDDVSLPFAAADLQALADATGRTVIDVAPGIRNGPHVGSWLPYVWRNHGRVMEAVVDAGLARDGDCIPVLAVGFAAQLALELSLSAPSDYCGVFASIRQTGLG